jgi:L-lysine 6-transaminase
MSLTNTVPVKTAYYPKFDWPRITNPKLRFPVDAAETERVSVEESKAVREIESAFAAHPHDIAAIIIEPIQGEGGDNHFRREFFVELRRLADENDALLIFDEVQTGFGMTGKFWAWEHFGVAPDIVAFGKKSQVCGIMAGARIDEISDNVFRVSSRLNSTWGGGLTDMVRCEIILETMARENLVVRAARNGARFLEGLEGLAARFPDRVSNVRGRGLLCAFDCVDAAARAKLVDAAREERLLILICGERSVRFRPALTISADEIDEGVARLGRALERL